MDRQWIMIAKVLLEFHGQNCKPCQIIAPIVDRLTAELGVELKKFDVGLDMKAAQQHGVRSIPTLILTQDGKELRRLVGGNSEAKIRGFLLG